MTKTYDEASKVAAEHGAVHVDGPDGVAVSMTPAAALRTASRLDAAAIDAMFETPGDLETNDRSGSVGLYLADDGLVMVNHRGDRAAIPFQTYEAAGYLPPLGKLPTEREFQDTSAQP